ncbi:unnamed protein product [Notodromas monacha]|uniref:Uncharacterized protein n=1 Tax=Notodromas monacha TaxID=399045 RepID=A0A7R9BUH4_9CRUS|nr:unnamed protein product [Notodromas monacha]CAG0921998.1 unnamed protein product [Notodromas monacha]
MYEKSPNSAVMVEKLKALAGHAVFLGCMKIRQEWLEVQSRLNVKIEGIWIGRRYSTGNLRAKQWVRPTLKRVVRNVALERPVPG